MSKKEISRRLFLKGTAAAGASVAAASLLAACGTDPATTTAVPVTTTLAPTAAPAPSTKAPETTPAATEPAATEPVVTEPAATEPPAPEFEWETGVTNAESVTGDPNRTWTLWDPADETKTLIREGRGDIGENGAVSSPDAWSAWAGVKVMQAGGNAVDAAAAVAFCISVCDPQHSGIGGGGFMTMRDAKSGEFHFINFRETAPTYALDGNYWPIQQSNPDQDPTDPMSSYTVVKGTNASTSGGRAVGVPGTVAGMAYAVEHYGSGKMKLADLIQPAVDLAKDGFWMGPTTSSSLDSNYSNLIKYPEFGKVYLLPDDVAEKLDRPIYKTGDKFTNPDQVKTLELIQELGPDAFYNGEITEAMINVINKYGGVFIKDDFANYTAKEKQPVEGEFMGKKIISVPLPSSGGTSICEILNILEAYGTDKLKAYGHNSAMYLHVLSEAMRLAYGDRSKYLYDYGEEVELERSVMNALTSKEYAKFLASLIKEDAIIPNDQVIHDPFEFEHQDTVSYSVADKEGNIVTVTFTVNGIFGAKLIPDGYGFILNNEMDDFNKNPYHPGHIAPGKYPLSSMSPTIVLNEDGTPFMTVGSPGGATIIAAVAQAILNVVLFGKEAQEAVDAPRISYTLNVENRVGAEVMAELEKMGHQVKDWGEWTPSAGSNQVIVYDYSEGKLKLHAGADPRRDCKAWAF